MDWLFIPFLIFFALMCVMAFLMIFDPLLQMQISKMHNTPKWILTYNQKYKQYVMAYFPIFALTICSIAVLNFISYQWKIDVKLIESIIVTISVLLTVYSFVKITKS